MGADVDVDLRIAGGADLEALMRRASACRDHLGRSTPLNYDLLYPTPSVSPNPADRVLRNRVMEGARRAQLTHA
jgi:hypothetical protein